MFDLAVWGGELDGKCLGREDAVFMNGTALWEGVPVKRMIWPPLASSLIFPLPFLSMGCSERQLKHRSLKLGEIKA